MQDSKLVAMANQIAGFFRPYPADEARKGIKQHLVAFWTPAMLDTLKSRIAANPDGINPLVVQAIEDE